MAGTVLPIGAATAAPPPGQDFNVTQGDLEFIIKQIEISEDHAEDVLTVDPDSSPLCNPGATFNVATQTHLDADGDACVGTPQQPFGLRTVDGRWNNLVAGQDGYGQSGQTFPRRLPADFKDAQDIPAGSPFGAPGPTTYKSTDGSTVLDSEPRTISNLIVDQTAGNTAAVQVAERTEGGIIPLTIERIPSRTHIGAAALSAAKFSPGVPVVYVTTGTDGYYGTLAASAAAAESGPVLLTSGSTIPAVTRTELARLQPARIVVVGSPAEISDAAVASLSSFAGNAPATRVSGSSRVATSAAISAAAFPPGTSRVYVTGNSFFAEPLAAAGPASRDGHPVLLTSVTTLSPETAAEITRLNPAEIVVVGSTARISQNVQAALDALGASTVRRISASNVINTALEVSKDSYGPATDTVYLASSTDAFSSLGAPAAAGREAAPMLLTTATSLPAAVIAEIQRLTPTRVVVLGPTATISEAVLAQLRQAVPGGTDVFIPDIATDAGLSASVTPFFTFFGQFFDHGLDQVSKGGNGSVIVPLQPDDPLYQPGSPTNFIPLTRATLDDGTQEHTNRTTPFVDQNQTYTSNASHQLFLREYEAGPDGPVNTGRLLNGAGGEGLATWADVKAQARTLLGIELRDSDVLDVPQVLVDPYGHFVPGANGLPQLILADGFREGNLANPVNTDGAARVGQAFLDDIAHTAVPNADPAAPQTHNAVLLGQHFATGDGRGNENIALTSVHHVFHSEHNRVMAQIDEELQTMPEELQARYEAAGPVWDYGERLFQAARFFTEMQYQHLVFEEFARRIQPEIDAVVLNENSYVPDVDPAIVAEFAHVVYRFGHSLLTEDIDRESAAGAADDVPLFDGFLNPTLFTTVGGQTVTADEGAGAIVRGTTRSVANGIDEFVTDTLRNRLLGLPLDLPTINMTRARDVGIPSLQTARQTFFDETQHPELEPYGSWEDFRLNMKNPESIVNFVAAYGNHPTLGSATTLAAKRTAATALVADAAFMNAPAQDTGVNEIDFWMGGLAEKPFVFGGMLGSTFNVVFEEQLENLQFGDRFYYLNRNLGNSLFHTLEANSFSQLIKRNTTADNIPHDVFAAAQQRFDLADPASLTGLTNTGGQWRYTGEEHVTFIGTDGADNIRSGIGDDSVWAGAGNDRVEGDDGVDALMGGDGDDILTDLFGIDRLQGETGNDVLNVGPGVGDLAFGGSGQDVIVAGTDATSTFAGLGDDFIFGSSGRDNARGDEGDDWIEGGSNADLLVGDLSNTMMNDPALYHGGHDVILGGTHNDDYDSEGGDDVMVGSTTGTERYAGMLGFDWVTHDGQAGNADVEMDSLQLVPDTQSAIIDRWLNTEAVSGYDGNDVIRGFQNQDDLIDPAIGTLGYGHRLTQEHLDRIEGFRDLLGGGASPEFAQPFLADVPSTQDDFNNNILLGGGGNDLIEPRSGRNFVDGDAWLDVNVVRRGADGAVVERADSLSAYRTRMFNRTLNPADLSLERRIQSNNAGTDTVVYAEPSTDFTIERRADGTVLVTQNNAAAPRQDVLKNIETLQFSNGTLDITLTPLPTAVTPLATLAEVQVADAEPVLNRTITATVADAPADSTTVFQLQTISLGADGEEVATTTQTNKSGKFKIGQIEAGSPVQVVAVVTDAEGTVTQSVSDPTQGTAEKAPETPDPATDPAAEAK